MDSVRLDQDAHAAAEELKKRQVTLLERITFCSRKMHTEELARLESRQTVILSQVSAVLGRLESSAFGDGKREESVENNQEPESEKGNSSAGKGSCCQIDDSSSSERKGDGNDVQRRLTQILSTAGATFLFKRVPSDYYSRSFEERRDLLGAASVDHLCKSIVMVNTQAPESVRDCSNQNYSKYYVIIIQYTARLNAEKVKKFIYSLNNGKISKKQINMRLAPEEESKKLTGFEHNAVTPFGMATDIPVIMADTIAKLEPEFFWLGGGEVDLKLGVRTDDFTRIVKPFIANCY